MDFDKHHLTAIQTNIDEVIEKARTLEA